MKKDNQRLALVLGEGSDPGPGSQPPLVTIDDLIQLARDLFLRLRILGEYKHPLAVRRGRKGVKQMVERVEGKMVKAGANTYFFDLKETRDGKRYLVITESRFAGEGKERERTSIAVFPEHAREFSESLAEMVAQLE